MVRTNNISVVAMGADGGIGGTTGLCLELFLAAGKHSVKRNLELALEIQKILIVLSSLTLVSGKANLCRPKKKS